MSGRVRGGQRPARRFNWLKRLDEQATELPSATSWLQPYGPFMLARYANLRPQPIAGDVHSQLDCESGERTAAQLFMEWESRIAENAEAAVCLSGLSAEQRRQLAALLLDTIDELKGCDSAAEALQWARHVHEETPTRRRVLDRRLKKARRAVEELENYAQDLRKRNSLDASRHLARRTLGHTYRVAAGRALKALDVKSLADAQEHTELAGERLTFEDPEVFGMVRLYWFFRHECRLSGHESEVRTARLRNAFWAEHGIRKVKFRPKYITGQSQGCEAVHVAVRRFHL